ncbi:phosphatase PAP2 family protein [Candidatus Woesebacteria bacterium]|nr:phosphatase PAP2 family protein [Candidatus Woesebacteria bacterium]
MNLLLSSDVAITSYLKDLIPHTSLFDSVFGVLSLQGLPILIWLILFAYFVYREHLDKTIKQFLLSFMLSFGITSLLVNIILKNLVMRVRPWIELNTTSGLCPSDFSFPSGHASGAFASAIIFAYFDRKRSWLYYSLAIGISYSRIYLNCHYFLDVLIGALIGAIIGFFVLKVLTWRRII